MTGRIDRSLNYAILTFFSLVAVLPIVGMLFVALHPPDEPVSGFTLPWPFYVHNFGSAWQQGHFSSYMRSSLIVTVSVVAASTLLSILGGYAFGTMRFRGSTVLFYILLLGLIVPYEATIVALYYDLRSAGITDTYFALILPQIGLSIPFGVFWMRAFFRSVPRSLLEAARIDGASTWTTLWRVLLPFGRPAVLTMMVLVFMWTWNEFLLPLVMITRPDLQTAPLGLAFFQGQHLANRTGLAAASVLIAAPIVLVYIFLQRHFIRGMMAGALKG